MMILQEKIVNEGNEEIFDPSLLQISCRKGIPSRLYTYNINIRMLYLQVYCSLKTVNLFLELDST